MSLKTNRNSTSSRTDRPDNLPTVAEVLRLPAVAGGLPRVLAGQPQLGNAVRWVHVVEARDVTELLDGHELLLATGVGWPEGDGWMAGYIAELAAADVAGLVLELGSRYRQAPERLVECCLNQSMPLVVLERKVKFVSITEAVHGRIIAEQMGALRARDEVHALFSGLSLRGSPADYIVAQLGAVLGSPVVLEDMAHQVVAFEASGKSEEEVLGSWESRSRSAHRARREQATGDVRTATMGTEGWLVTPVEARGARWGYLVAFDGTPHPAGRALVLEQAAVALSLSRLADGTAENWTPAAQHWLLASLLQGRYRSDVALAARFEAMGLPVAQRRLCGIALRTPSDMPSSSEVGRLARSMGFGAVASWTEQGGTKVLLIALSLPSPRQGREHPEADMDAWAAKLSALTRETPGSTGSPTMAAGAVVDHIGGLAASLQEALDVLGSLPGTAASPQPATLHRTSDRALRRLIGQLRGDPRLQSYVELSLGTLLQHDAHHGSDLMQVLRAYLAHPGNRTRAAANSHLSRSVFYQRLETIGDLLGVDLSDGEVIAELQAAAITWEATQGRAPGN
ncbi:PucR family transcriptional regulator [Arthrobacter sp. HY1533]|uniref:PucR family transcriptional regulator n=1 Tax=Arthrobacter sp. HY1533 TaxID=2970919 RepID=UPI0022B9EB5E|nr:PucR family transcriptional regulator ligand-binding domain-containing protein [Arthrobacter sp. HY1533]